MITVVAGHHLENPAQRSGPANGPDTTVERQCMAGQVAAQAQGMACWGRGRQTVKRQEKSRVKARGANVQA
jgi:hypothetical protein